ncbi:hypothetical protein Hanom_Chr03g00187111 [Helianthus anomalus]
MSMGMLILWLIRDFWCLLCFPMRIETCSVLLHCTFNSMMMDWICIRECCYDYAFVWACLALLMQPTKAAELGLDFV